MDRKHAFASASSAKRWMKCTASPGFIERNRHQLPEETESAYSIEGTEAHDLAAQCLVLGFDEALFPDTEAGREMAKHIKGYVDVVNGWTDDDAQLFVEQEVPLFYHPDEDGFLDAAVVTTGVVRIADLKYGKGVSVQARNNPQLAIYGLSLIENLSWMFGFTDNTLVTLMIYQPRIEGESPIRLWAVSLGELRAFCVEIERTARAIYSNPSGGEFSPDDDTCRFCPAVPVCGARAAQLFGALPSDTQTELFTPKSSKVPFPLPESLTVDQLTRLVAIAPELKEWLNKCEAHAAHRLFEGLPLPGFKLVEGRSNRKWRNDGEAAELLQLYTDLPVEEIFKVDVISPAQAEEKLSKAAFERIRHAIEKPPGKPTMVPETDKRPSIVANPANIFPNLELGTSLLE